MCFDLKFWHFLKISPDGWQHCSDVNVNSSRIEAEDRYSSGFAHLVAWAACVGDAHV